jgi:hypothetical protein
MKGGFQAGHWCPVKGAIRGSTGLMKRRIKCVLAFGFMPEVASFLASPLPCLLNNLPSSVVALHDAGA